MKKHFKSFLTVVCLLSAVVVLNSCGGDDEVPANVISDDAGLKVELTWTAAGTGDVAIENADIDLFLYHDVDAIESSIESFDFEEIIFDENSLYFEDGTYVVKVRFWNVDEDGTYTVKVTGKNVTKTWTFDRSFELADENKTVYVSVGEIKKAGSKYTMSEIN